MSERQFFFIGMGINTLASFLAALIANRTRNKLLYMKTKMDPDDFVLEKKADKLKTITYAVFGFIGIGTMLTIFIIIELVQG